MKGKEKRGERKEKERKGNERREEKIDQVGEKDKWLQIGAGLGR